MVFKAYRITHNFKSVRDHDLQCSESYTGTINQETTVEGYQYCSSLDRAFQQLTSENFNNFVLTIGCTAVEIYCKGNVVLKIFHSQGIFMIEDILKVHVCCLEYHH